VENCYSTSAVIADTAVGGIVGFNTGTVRNCYATGAVSGTGASSEYIGGVVGNNYGGTVQNCYATGSVTGMNSVGGIVGKTINTNVTYCVALNSNLSGNVLGRVVAETSSALPNNYGRNDMKQGGSSVGWTAGFISSPGIENGADISSANWNNAGWWTDTATFASAVWDITANKLPTLKDMPSGTQDPSP
jgi:hypothetical protein